MIFSMPNKEMCAILSLQRDTTNCTEERVRLSDLRVWQNRLYLERLLQLDANPLSWQPVWTYRLQGQLWLIDGHHRCMVAEIRGDDRIRALVWEAPVLVDLLATG